MGRQLQSDKILFVAVAGLVLFGALMVYSASAVLAADRYHEGYYFLIRQLAWAGVGLIAVAVLMHTDYRRLANPMVIFPAVAFEPIMLIVVLFVHPKTTRTGGFIWDWRAFSPRSWPRSF